MATNDDLEINLSEELINKKKKTKKLKEQMNRQIKKRSYYKTYYITNNYNEDRRKNLKWNNTTM